MQDVKQSRKVSELADDLNAMRTQCARVGELLTGLAIVFGATGAVVLAAGLWLGEPLFAVSFGVMLAAAIGFAACSQAASRALKAAPRIQPAYGPTRLDSATVWRRAA